MVYTMLSHWRHHAEVNASIARNPMVSDRLRIEYQREAAIFAKAAREAYANAYQSLTSRTFWWGYQSDD